MANEFTNTVGLAQACRDAGLEVWELDGWKTNEQGYYWVNEYGYHAGYLGQPLGATHHHTASGGYSPFVKNGAGQTKANVFLGMRRGNRLYQEGGGTPTLAFCSAGPADYSAGKNNPELIRDYLPDDRRFLGPQRKADVSGFYGNRYVWATEIVARGDGSPIEAWDLLIGYSAVLCEFFGWSAWRIHGHYDLTRRKIDPKLQHGPYTISTVQDLTLEELTIGAEEMYAIGPNYNANPEDVSYVQRKLTKLGFYTGAPDGLYGPKTTQAVKDFQVNIGGNPDGIVWGYIGAEMDFALAQAGGGSCNCNLDNYALKNHPHSATTTIT